MLVRFGELESSGGVISAGIGKDEIETVVVRLFCDPVTELALRLRETGQLSSSKLLPLNSRSIKASSDSRTLSWISEKGSSTRIGNDERADISSTLMAFVDALTAASSVIILELVSSFMARTSKNSSECCCLQSEQSHRIPSFSW
ncbi:uncharacterized protein LOC129741028 [Uranotaenia lowii]|uniref:uncharacterized protein LOC129741028 n=1 Tax=Uranotaenia lowii TaxID=190385 RepID=UPI002479358A|nr:uncharacterized protein LOC129741028 [Uranotaenia lowii]